MKKQPLEYQIVTKTYLKPNYLSTYLCDSSDGSDSSDISDISDSSDSNDKKILSLKNFCSKPTNFFSQKKFLTKKNFT